MVTISSEIIWKMAHGNTDWCCTCRGGERGSQHDKPPFFFVFCFAFGRKLEAACDCSYVEPRKKEVREMRRGIFVLSWISRTCIYVYICVLKMPPATSPFEVHPNYFQLDWDRSVPTFWENAYYGGSSTIQWSSIPESLILSDRKLSYTNPA